MGLFIKFSKIINIKFQNFNYLYIENIYKFNDFTINNI